MKILIDIFGNIEKINEKEVFKNYKNYIEPENIFEVQCADFKCYDLFPVISYYELDEKKIVYKKYIYNIYLNRIEIFNYFDFLYYNIDRYRSFIKEVFSLFLRYNELEEIELYKKLTLKIKNFFDDINNIDLFNELVELNKLIMENKTNVKHSIFK